MSSLIGHTILVSDKATVGSLIPSIISRELSTLLWLATGEI